MPGDSNKRRVSMRRLILAIAIAATTVPVATADTVLRLEAKVITEAQLRTLSEEDYFKILQAAYDVGWRYAPMDIQSGLRHNLSEWRARLLDRGFVIRGDDSGA